MESNSGTRLLEMNSESNSNAIIIISLQGLSNENYEIHQSHTPDKERPFGSVLTLIDVSHLYVGFYYCIKNDSFHPTDPNIDEQSHIDELKSSFKASEIYVYVNGKINIYVFFVISIRFIPILQI